MDNTEITATNATQAATGEQQAERTFTQAEVDKIISDRLARAKEQYSQQPKEDAREAALKEREAAVAAKESRFQCENYLREINLSEKHRGEFLDTLDTANFEQFKKIVDVLGKPYIVTTTVIGAQTAHPPVSTSTRPDFSEAFRPHKR
jgi:hypothetical protein